MLLDFHTHILPNIDDGSQSIEESVLLLYKLKKQGCEVVAATPHFMADKDTPQSFFMKRAESYNAMMDEIADNEQLFPRLLLGAEVLYYPGISKMKDLSAFCLEDSKLLLLEMPVSQWSDSVVRELLEMSCSGEYQVVLAHFERYIDIQRKDVWQRLSDSGIMLQTNASFIIHIKTRRKALKMLKKGQIHFIGSDCHNVKHRPPRIGEAVSVINDKLGLEFIKEWESFQGSFFR